MEIRSTGKIQIVEAGMVEHLTSVGWKLVAIVHSDITHYVQREIENKSSHGSYGGFQSIREPVEHNVPLFVLELDEQSALFEASSTFEAVRSQNSELVNSLQAASASIQDLTLKLKKSEDELEDVCKRYHDTNNAHQRDRASLQRLEADLAKIRKSIGDLKMKEILGQ